MRGTGSRFPHPVLMPLHISAAVYPVEAEPFVMKRTAASRRMLRKSGHNYRLKDVKEIE
jgi:hypothetical protein